LSEEDLKLAFSEFFRIADRTELNNGRVLLLLERKAEECNPGNAAFPEEGRA
jgi:hypothetical protein